MKDMRDSLKDIYNDFYGSVSDAMEADVLRSEKSGAEKAEIKVPVSSETPKVEVDVVTQSDSEEEIRKKAAAVLQEKEEQKEPEKSGMEELEELVGLDSVKHDVKELIGLAKVRKMREEKEMKTAPVSLHLVFSGNPGTGKTTVARILAKLYKEIGILSEGQLVETDRSGLVAGYVGQTAIKTQKKIKEAMGGVLFIDEAYTLNQEGENFGQEAIDTILKAMEDHRDKFIVIVAGYTQLMKDFVESNPGLRSRFNKFFEFPDYTADELKKIFDLQCDKYEYKLSDEAKQEVHKEIERLEEEKGENFANAREVRNLFEKIITNQAARVAELEDVDQETLATITVDDLKDFKEEEKASEPEEEIKSESDESQEPATEEQIIEELEKLLDKE